MVIAAGKEGITGAAGDPAAEHRAASPPPPPPLSQSRLLHNFSFPTHSWGVQRFLRCSKVPVAVAAEPIGSAAPLPDRNRRTARTESSPPRPLPRGRDSKEGDAGGREEREADKAPSCAAVTEATRPWNLRTRRAACNAPAEERYGNHGSASGGLATEKKTVRLISDETEKRETGTFSVSLSRAEIEEDFFAIKGTRPHRRPKKRAKIVQRQLDSLFPGLWLSEITPDAYKIVE